MDGNRFDDLTRAFYRRRSRRQLIRSGAAIVAGFAGGLRGRGFHLSLTGSNVYAQTATVTPCDLTCPANVTQANDPNQSGAVVTYPAPTTTGSYGTVTCSPASGSFFPGNGVPTTVTCTSVSGPSCSFTVTVNDTEPPVVTCPADIKQSTDPGLCSAVVN